MAGIQLNTLVWYAGLYATSAAGLKLAGFGLFLWLAHSLSVNDYATFGLFYALQTGITTFAIAGIVEVVIGLLKDNRPPAMRQKLFGAANACFALMALLVVALVLLGFGTFAKPSGSAYRLLLCVLPLGILLAFSSLQAQITRLEERHLSSLCFSFLAPLIGLSAAGMSFLLERNIESFFLGFAIGLSVALASLWALRVGVYGLEGRRGEIRPILMRIAPFIAMAFLGWLSGYGNNYIIKGFFEPVEIARFTFALSVSSIMQLVASALNQVWSPRFYRIVHELSPSDVENRNRRFFRLQSWVLGLVGGTIVAVFPTAMNFLRGNLVAYQSMNIELSLLIFSYALLTPWWHCQNYYLVHGKGREFMRISVVTSIIGIVVWVSLMWLLGAIGIYVGFLTQMLVRTLVIVTAARRMWAVRIAWDGVVAGMVFVIMGLVLSAG